MSCFFFYFKPMGLYSGGLIHGLMFTSVTGVGLYEDGLILGWAYPWQSLPNPYLTCAKLKQVKNRLSINQC